MQVSLNGSAVGCTWAEATGKLEVDIAPAPSREANPSLLSSLQLSY